MICLCGIKLYDKTIVIALFTHSKLSYEIKYNKYIKTYRQLNKLLQQSNYFKDFLD